MLETEIEVKVLGYLVDEYIRMLENIGATFVAKEVQINHRFINANVHGDSYLRLREVDGECVFTLKERNCDSKSARINKEYNTKISDGKTFLQIMQKIGFNYSTERKVRLKYSYKNFIFDIDSWDEEIYPFPYMEIEAKSIADLDEIIDLLGIDKKHISTKSIKELISDLDLSK